MPYEPNYFGVSMGNAISAGARHISDALQRRYEMQMQDKERQQMLAEQQRKETSGRTFEMQKLGYDNTPESLDSFISDRKKARELENANTQAQTNMLNRRAETVGQKPPSSYRYTESGNLELIPGSPEDRKAQESAEKNTKAIESNLSEGLKVVNALDEADKLSDNWFSTGWSNLAFSEMPNTNAKSLNNYIKTIESNIGFDRLTAMRNASKTGGALGNVSDRELSLLVSSAGPLDPTDRNFKKNLEFIQKHYKRFISGLKDYSGYSKEAISADLISHGFSPEESRSLTNSISEIKSNPFGQQIPQRQGLTANPEQRDNELSAQGIKATRTLKSGQKVNVISYDNGKTWQEE